MFFSVKQKALLSEGNGIFTKQKNAVFNGNNFVTIPQCLRSKFCMQDLSSNMCIA